MGEQAGESASRKLWRALTGYHAGLVTILLLCLVGIYYFGFREMRFFMVPSDSMVPTLVREDQIMTLNEHQYHRGDIVVAQDNDGYLVKRVVGLPGDRLMVMDGALFVNGKYVSEPYVLEPMEYIMAPVDVPGEHVFLLGDNRNISDDDHLTRRARPMRDIVGKVRYIYYPYHRLGAVMSYPLTDPGTVVKGESRPGDGL